MTRRNARTRARTNARRRQARARARAKAARRLRGLAEVARDGSGFWLDTDPIGGGSPPGLVVFSTDPRDYPYYYSPPLVASLGYRPQDPVSCPLASWMVRASLPPWLVLDCLLLHRAEAFPGWTPGARS